MIGIKGIAAYIPEQQESNSDRKLRFGIDDEFLVQKIGVKSKPKKKDCDDTSDMCLEAFAKLIAKYTLAVGDIDCIVVCTQNPDGYGLPHTSAILHGKLGCKDETAAFDISLGCSGYVYSLSIVASFMETNGMKNGLLFTADPYSKIVNPDDKNTSLLFGDAATVTWLGENPSLKLDKVLFATAGQEYKALENVNGHLRMNGRAVFNFTMSRVPHQLKKMVEKSGCHVDDIDIIIFHQASKYVLDMLSRRLNLPGKKVPSNLENMGNTVSSSIPLILQNYVNDRKYKNILVCGFGAGLSWATALLKRK